MVETCKMHVENEALTTQMLWYELVLCKYKQIGCLGRVLPKTSEQPECRNSASITFSWF
ncbi:hypothetical protein Scep_013292 [Stephania cephalantha]|uniref:Uncharacterized protein n=1 Tax=Stephania cephalantha TaxID=152367 RepID=A0AAP0P8C1_9MAGN